MLFRATWDEKTGRPHKSGLIFSPNSSEEFYKHLNLDSVRTLQWSDSGLGDAHWSAWVLRYIRMCRDAFVCSIYLDWEPYLAKEGQIPSDWMPLLRSRYFCSRLTQNGPRFYLELIQRSLGQGTICNLPARIMRCSTLNWRLLYYLTGLARVRPPLKRLLSIATFVGVWDGARQVVGLLLKWNIILVSLGGMPALQ